MIGKEYLRVVTDRFRYMKKIAEDAMKQVSDSSLFWYENEDSNSIAVIVKHMSGNMVSRWTDFFTADGEKETRNRDNEFKQSFIGRPDIMNCWDRGWNIFLSTLEGLKEEDLLKVVTIRNEPHSVMEAIERQMYHYSYHVGQIVYISKQLSSQEWKSLTIPRVK
ncbi:MULTISPECIES: DUF1572 family protein [Bacillus]|uniref:DUF1572 family protein n=1 Tax=Bacillus TaxID=1386 RepID=UPI0002DE225E|nr:MULTISPECIES: DUF1572 family protein [Bacillus]